MGTTHKYVNTNSGRLYLVAEVDEETKPSRTILKGALAVAEVEPDEDDEDDDRDNVNTIAKDYVTAMVSKKLKTIELKADAIETIEEAEDVSRAIAYLASSLEDAERKVKAKNLRGQLDRLLG